MGYFMVIFFYSYWLTILQKHVGQILPILAMLYGNFPLIFNRFFLSKDSILFPILICRCFVTFFNKYFWLYFHELKFFEMHFLCLKTKYSTDWCIDWVIDWTNFSFKFPTLIVFVNKTFVFMKYLGENLTVKLN